MTKPRKLESLVKLVDRALSRALPRGSAVPPVLQEAMRYAVFSGGKRFRPLLCLGACEAAGASARQALPAACAVELVHAYSLVHDDLPAMDNADTRRGQPTCHRKFGEGAAILAGDALLTLAFALLGRHGARQALAIVRLLGEACGTAGLIGGQVLDLQAISQPRLGTEPALRAIAERKTAALIAASVVAGGISGGATTVQLRRLERYGRHVGLAFQLIDDVHDGDGLAQALGEGQARGEARRLIARATEALEPFGRRAETLRRLASWLASTVEQPAPAPTPSARLVEAAASS
jgi:geranylgeranyl diphosphate synthase type II